MIAFLKKYKKKVQEENGGDIIQFISKRVCPLFAYKEYFLYEEENLNVYKLKPKLERTQFVNFFDYKKFNKFLKKQKINLPSFDIHHIKYMFEHGALAFCAVIDHDLAHITWVAMDETAKKKLEPWSMEVDWDIEACWGLAQTSPAYLRLGLYSCVHAQVAMYLKSKGIKKNKFTINKSNIPSNQAMSKFHPEVFANGYYLKFFFWVFRIKVNKT